MTALTASLAAVDRVRRGLRRRALLVAAAMTIVLLVAATLALGLGDYPMDPWQVLRTLVGGGTRIESYIVWETRMPRFAMAVVAGGALALAGTLLQGLLRNPLASPDLLGISGGASVAAVVGLLVFGIGGPLLAVVAFGGGAAVAVLLLVAAARRGQSGFRIILAGIGVSFLCACVIDYLLTRSKIEQAQAAYVWLAGSLNATPWWQVATVAAVVVVTLPAVLLAARDLPVLALGPGAASGLGVRLGFVRLAVIAAAVLLTATVCAFCGPISFVALCAPAIARSLRRGAAPSLGTSALVGSVLLVGADLVAQHAWPGRSIPVGAVTGALGAVFLLWLLATSKGRFA